MTLDASGNCQRPVFSIGVSQHMHKITNIWKFKLDWSSKLRDNNERKTPLSHEVVYFQMLDFGTSKSNSEVSKSNSNICVEKYFFLKKTTLFQREPFLMFYTINSAPLFVTKLVVMLTIILIKYHQCPVHLSIDHFSCNAKWLTPLYMTRYKSSQPFQSPLEIIKCQHTMVVTKWIRFFQKDRVKHRCE